MCCEHLGTLKRVVVVGVAVVVVAATKAGVLSNSVSSFTGGRVACLQSLSSHVGILYTQGYTPLQEVQETSIQLTRSPQHVNSGCRNWLRKSLVLSPRLPS